MRDELTPRFIRTLHLVGGLALCALLVLSAVLVGRFALGFGLAAGRILAESGLAFGIDRIVQALADRALLDVGGPIPGEALVNVAAFAGAVAICVFLLAYSGIFLAVLGLAWSWLRSGIWAFERPVLPPDLPLPWQAPGAVIERLDARALPPEVEGRGRRFAFGRRYVPRSLGRLADGLALPYLRAAARLFAGLFLAGLTLAALAGLMIVAAEAVALPVPPVGALVADLVQRLGPAASVWLLALAGLALLLAIADAVFLRGILPRPEPKAERSIELVEPEGSPEGGNRALRINAPPAQIDALLRTALEIRLDDARYASSGTDRDRDSFADHSSFRLEALIETPGALEPSPAAGAARRHAVLSLAVALAGAGVLLLLATPIGVFHAVRGELFRLSDWLVAPLGLALALVTGLTALNAGRRGLLRAEQALRVGWFRTPVVALRLDGTVNTQRTGGNARDDSTGAELRIQQSRFHARLVSASVLAEAPDMDAERTIWSFERDASSEALREAVARLLRDAASERLRDTAQDELSPPRREPVREDLRLEPGAGGIWSLEPPRENRD